MSRGADGCQVDQLDSGTANQSAVRIIVTNHNTAMSLSNIPVNIDQQKL